MISETGPTTMQQTPANHSDTCNASQK